MTVLSHDGSNVFLHIISSWGQVFMKKLSMVSQVSITFEQGCDRYLLNCKQRNLRQGTINHYKQSYTQFYRYFDRNMPLSEITEQVYKNYVVSSITRSSVEMMGLIGAGINPMVGMTVACAVAIEEASK